MIFDPAAVNRQIDSFLATVPEGKKVTILAHADLMQKKVSGGVAIKLFDGASAFARVSKTFGGPTEADAGIRISFLAGPPDTFSYAELVEVFKARGQGWVKAHMNAWRLFEGKEVEL